jgi:hypothetical protein
MTIDIVDPRGVALDIKDAIADLALDSHAALLGHLVETLVRRNIIDAEALRQILPRNYEVREFVNE